MTANELPAAPAWDDDTKALSSAWKAWWKLHDEALPETIGELADEAPSAPVRLPADLDDGEE